MAIKWTNIYSNETGYVQSVNTKENHFVNTYDIASAKVYKTASAAKAAINKLIAFGEGTNNTFEIVAVN